MQKKLYAKTIMIKRDFEIKWKRQCYCEVKIKNIVARDASFKMASEKGITNINVQNWRSKTADSKLRRFYEGLDCARLFNTRYLLDYTSVDLRGSKGRLALSIVCQIGDEKAKSRRILFDWLLREKCDFNLQDSDGLTLIAWLCKNNRQELFDAFIKKCEMDIDYTTPDANEDSPLMHAVRTGNIDIVKEIVRILVKFGISVDKQNKDGLSPYAEAVRLDFVDIAEILEKEGQASTNVYVEPLWTLKTYGHCFKDVLSESVDSKENIVESKGDTLKELEKTKPKRKASSVYNRSNLALKKTSVVNTDSSTTSSGRKLSRKKDIIAIEPSPFMSKKKERRKKSSCTAQRKSLAGNSPDTNRMKSTTSEANQTEEDVLVKELSKVSSEKTSNGRNGKKSNEKTSKKPLSRRNSHKGDECLGSVPGLRMRKNNCKPQKALQRKSIAPQKLWSPNATPDNFDRVAFEENRMFELMQYRTQPSRIEQITYQDVNRFYPAFPRVSSASKTQEHLRWLLRLRVEQNELLPMARYLSKNDVDKIVTPPERLRSRKSGLGGMATGERSEYLCNAVLNRILNSKS
ncbi:uncharacterized protein [Clytia hemisphaerica]|uniref:uncharacterized protein n=1 Tax=Clytia hemisphaerica TaxID=252671 RepID=UPI0034D5BBC3